MREFQLLRVLDRDADMVVSFEPSDFNRRTTARQIAVEIETVIESCQGRRVLLDLREATWLSSAALNQLIRLRCRASDLDLSLVLMNVQKTVRQIFSITRLDRQFGFSDSEVLTG